MIIHALDALCGMAIVALAVYRMLYAAWFADWRTFMVSLTMLALVCAILIHSLPNTMQACTPITKQGNPTWRR